MMVFRPSFEKLADRFALAMDVGAFCEAWPNESDATQSTASAISIASKTADPVVALAPVAAKGEGEFVAPPAIDPDGNGVLNEEDVLFMLFVVNQDGLGEYRPLFDQPADRDFVSGADFAEEQHAMRWNACNVDQDLFLSPLDVLVVINEINAKKSIGAVSL